MISQKFSLRISTTILKCQFSVRRDFVYVPQSDFHKEISWVISQMIQDYFFIKEVLNDNKFQKMISCENWPKFSLVISHNYSVCGLMRNSPAILNDCI